MKYIDAHNHPDWLGYNLERTLENMDAMGIERMWLLTWEAPDDEVDPGAYYPACPRWNEYGPMPYVTAREYARQAPDRFLLGYAPDPRRPESLDKLRAAIAHDHVRIYGELKLRMTFDNPDALEIYRFCGEHGLPVVTHTDYAFDRGSRYPRPNYWYGGGIDALERAVRACPETIFLGHGPGFWAHISGDERYATEPYPQGPVLPGGRVTELLRRYPNLYGDLSAGSALTAISRDPEFGLAFIEEFADRLLFARDYFDDRLKKHLESLDLPNATLAAIAHGNAERLVPVS